MPGGLNGPPITSGGAYAYPSKTLAALRSDVLIRLGFITPLGAVPGRSRLELRQAVKDAIGLADPLLVETRTLAQLRQDVLDEIGLSDPITSVVTRSLIDLRDDVARALGFGQTVLPPGLPEYLNLTINEAQQRLHRRLELDRGASAAPNRMVLDASVTTLDYVPVQILAIALAKAHYGQADAKVYFEQLEKLLADGVGRRPPNIIKMIDSFIDEAQATVFRRLEMDKGGVAFPARMTVDADPTTIDYKPVLALAVALTKAKLGQQDAKIHLDQSDRYLSDQLMRAPPNIDDIINKALKEAQETVYRRYELGIVTYALASFTGDADLVTIDYRPVLALAVADVKALLKQPDAKRYYDEVERYFADLYKRKPPGVDAMVNSALQDAQEQLYFRYTALRHKRWWMWTLTADSRFYDVVKDGTLNVDFRKVESVWIEEGGNWQRLSEGIDPNQFDIDQSGIPTNYELREYIELWPAPSSSTMKLWLFGHLGLKPFVADSDTTTIDYHPVFLKALAMLKAHYGQRDAAGVDRDLQIHVGDLNAETFGNKRFIPGNVYAGKMVGPNGVDYGPNVRYEEGGGVRRMEDA